MKILFTGFEPFGGENINPSWEAVKQLPDTIDDIQIGKVQVPVEYQAVSKSVQDAITSTHPDCVICVGQAGGRKSISIERVALNLDDSLSADNIGAVRRDEPIRRGAPCAYFSTLPIKSIAKAIGDAGISAEISNTAGTFVCNHLMFSVLDYFSLRMLDTRAGFIHVPYLPEQCVDKRDMPCMELSAIVDALAIAARTVARK